MSVFNRPMFRIPGMGNNQPGGIMASGPNIIRASVPGNVSNRNQITSNFTIPANLYEGQTKRVVDRKGGVLDGSAGIANEGEKTLQEKKKESLLEKFKRDAQKNLNIRTGSLMVDNPDPVTGFMSQQTDTTDEVGGDVDTEESFSGGDISLKDAPLSDEGTANAGIGDNTQESDVNILKGFQSNQKQLSDKVQAAITNVAAGVADANAIKIGGKTLSENADALYAKMSEKGKEPTLADIQDDAIQLLGFDPKELQGEFEEDRKASIFLNMMKAGLAIAAGESPNALTNVAKGFAVGLQGYGQDVNRLTKQLREDQREARSTMYNLLKDKKSEQLAERTLELQKMNGIVNLQRTLVGDAKNDAIQQFNQQMAGYKWNLNLLSTAADLQFKEKELAVTKENADKVFKAALIRAEPDVIKILKRMGHIGEDGTPTDTGNEFLTKYLKEVTKGTSTLKDSEFNRKAGVIGKDGVIPNTYIKTPTNYGELSDEKKESFGIAGVSLDEKLTKITGSPIQQFNEQLQFVRSMRDTIPGLKISLNNLPKVVLDHIKKVRKGVRIIDQLQEDKLLSVN
tara:strand:- start:4757 stop:6463 length:1707 start_codon:yes stop_codon:yes gene_type:complete